MTQRPAPRTRSLPRPAATHATGRLPRASATLATLALLITGCSSPWQQSFEPVPGVAISPVASPVAVAVALRRVPWERLDAALTELEGDLAASDIHPDEWPADRRAARDARLLTALQFSEPPDRCTILGRSVFTSTTSIRPTDGELADFARSIGATHAVWSTRFAGTTQIVRQEPVRSSTTEWGRRRSDDRYDSFSASTTAYVPVVVEADQHAWIAYFVRVAP